MTVEELKNLSNENITISLASTQMMISCSCYKYADCIRFADCKSIEMHEDGRVLISVPKGTAMGDHEIVLDFSTGLVVADGKCFDEPYGTTQQIRKPVKKKATTSFTPTINGFSIGSVRMMPSEDGYACSCKVYFNGMKVGDFLDKGDGSEYSFYADPPYKTSKIEKVVRSFPSTNRDYGFGPMEVPYDIGQMVDDLCRMKEISKNLMKLQAEEKDYVLIDEWKTGSHLSAAVSSEMTDEIMADLIRNDMNKRGLNGYEVKRYRSLEDLIVENVSSIKKNELIIFAFIGFLRSFNPFK